MNAEDDLSLPYLHKRARVGAFQMSFWDEGQGDQVLLCVHGNPTWSYYFRNVVNQFSTTHRVVVVDHLGCGNSDKPRRDEFPYTLAAHRDNLLALIDQLGLTNITLVAHDWGGAIGTAAMVRRRDLLSRVVLLNTGAFPPPYIPWRIRACRIPVLGTLGVRGLNLFARAAIRMAMSRNRMNPTVARTLLSPYDNWDHRVAIDAFVKDIPASKKHPTYQTLVDLERELETLAEVPSLLVWGMKDWCFREECLRRFEKHWPQAHTVEIADAGHYVLEDAAEETLAAIEQFLGGDFQREESE